MKPILPIFFFTICTVFARFQRPGSKPSADSTVTRTRTERTEAMRRLEELFQDERLKKTEDMDMDRIFKEFSDANPRIKMHYIKLREMYQNLLNGKRLKKKGFFGKKSAKYKRTMKEAGRIVMLVRNEFEMKPGFDLSKYVGLRRLTQVYFYNLEKEIDALFE